MHDGEQPLYAVISHWSTHLGGYLGLVFVAFLAIVAWVFSPAVSILMLLVAVFGFAMIELVRRADRLALYRDGIAREYRLFTTRKTFAEYESVQDLEVTQSFIERLLGTGTIHVNTSGSHGQEIVFRGITRPHDLEAAIRTKMRPVPVDTPRS